MDWVAGILELIGLWKVGNKSRFGFVFNGICCLCWITYVITSRSAWGLLVIVVPAFFVNIRNFLKWRREDINSIEATTENDSDEKV